MPNVEEPFSASQQVVEGVSTLDTEQCKTATLKLQTETKAFRDKLKVGAADEGLEIAFGRHWQESVAVSGRCHIVSAVCLLVIFHSVPCRII
jgi:hypothetical protein